MTKKLFKTGINKSKALLIGDKEQITFVSYTPFKEGENITFELVLYTSPNEEPQTGCNIVMPQDLGSIKASIPLIHNGKIPALDKDNSYVIVSAPQGFYIRAINNSSDDDVAVYYEYSKTV